VRRYATICCLAPLAAFTASLRSHTSGLPPGIVHGRLLFPGTVSPPSCKNRKVYRRHVRGSHDRHASYSSASPASPSNHPPSSPPPLTTRRGSSIYGFHVFCLVVTYFEYYAAMFPTPILLMGHPTASVPGSAACRPYALFIPITVKMPGSACNQKKLCVHFFFRKRAIELQAAVIGNRPSQKSDDVWRDRVMPV